MSYCLSLACQHPQNQNGTRFCQSCGAKLLLGDRYHPIQPISQGGFGRTFLAVDEYKPSKPYCVIKQFSPQAQGDRNAQKVAELFEQEAVRLDELGKHPQIPELLAHFEEENCQYLVQEFIEGQNLAQKLTQTGSFSEAQIIELLNDLLPVLQFVHKENIIHRDIKPENIIQRFPPPSPSPTLIPFPEGQLVLVDFGASKLAPRTAISVTGTVIGSAGYTAPEQAAGKAVFASDIYSLGVTCVHLLTQKDPFDLYSFDQGIWVWQDYLSTPLSDTLTRILDKMLAGATNHRYQSVAEVVYELQAAAINSSSSPIPLTVPTHPSPTAKPELIVAKLGAANYKTIRAAIKNAEPGTRIWVRPGFYREHLTIDKDVEIIGDGQPEDIIIESQYRPCITMQAEKATVKGLTLRHREWSNLHRAGFIGRLISQVLFYPYAIALPKGQLILENCTITSTGIACIYIHGATANPQIRHCQIQDGAESGILVSRKGRGLVEDCDILNHDSGVQIMKGGNPTLRRCKIQGMKQEGVFIAKSSEATIADCQIVGNTGAGVTIKNGGNATIHQCRINRNQEQGIYVESNGAGPIEQCNLKGNRGGAWYIAPQCSVRRCGNQE
ncbi:MULTISPECIES: right-handed parallel beta-helix repeat-containing protein [unclassified Coleofasciculus]|uniref:right-handed parallel beta-helix repeat-containing protein n=1 Tax=unclassified Coleofasciculus TaxID=2692782 RepID=UPI00187EBF9C|nr:MULTISPECIES: right-handed parallel beta-helix repeat-containing protein [unclassified Coleofasciculus]MBE9128302.1 right-handed parallel beta-helix repeat-containing protein [Coleofasciculus sp. LEGE 07081]MBE9151330.1 right-handed parallel beta-helix repeat-containing protein [Coleofasciculus sp. LEGE 07092]